MICSSKTDRYAGSMGRKSKGNSRVSLTPAFHQTQAFDSCPSSSFQKVSKLVTSERWMLMCGVVGLSDVMLKEPHILSPMVCPSFRYSGSSHLSLTNQSLS